MDTLFTGILQLVVKTLIVFLLARSSESPIKATTTTTTLAKPTQVARKTPAPIPPAVRRVAPSKKSVR
jgi:hypothetical protein